MDLRKVAQSLSCLPGSTQYMDFENCSTLSRMRTSVEQQFGGRDKTGVTFGDALSHLPLVFMG